MTVEVRWYDDSQTILHYAYIGNYTWEEVYAAVEAGYKLAESVQHPVGSIIDMTAAGPVPKGALTHGRQLNKRVHANVIVQVTVGTGTFIRTMAETFNKLYGMIGGQVGTFFADSVVEAQEIIKDKLANTP